MQGSPRSSGFFNEAAHYPLPASTAISPTYPRSGADSPVNGFQHDQSNINYSQNQQQQQQHNFAQQYANQNRLSGGNPGSGSGGVDGAAAYQPSHQRLQQSNPSSAYSSLSNEYNYPFQDPIFNLSSNVQRDSDGSGGTISPSPAAQLATANAHLNQYKSSPMANLPSGIPAPVNLQQQQQFQQQQQPMFNPQNQQSGSALPHYLINPDALSNALNDWQNMSNGNQSVGKGKGKFSSVGNGGGGFDGLNEKNAWNSAPVSAGNSPSATPSTGGGGAKPRNVSGNKSNSKKKKTGTLTTGTTTPGGVGLSSSQFSSSSNQNQSSNDSNHHKVPTSSRVASSSVTGKRLNWAEMIVFTIADQPEGRMVVHDLFEGMVKKFPEINEWADGPGWESRVKNRIKSTLSIKGNLFIKVARASTDPVPTSSASQDQKSKGSWWTLSEESRTALRDGNVPAVVRAKPGKEEKSGKSDPTSKEGSQERGRELSHNGGRSGTSSAAHSRRSSPVRVGNSARSARGVGSGHHLPKGQQEMQAMTMTTASPKNQNHAGLYGMTSYNPSNQQYNNSTPNFSSDSPTSPMDATSPESVSSNPGGSSRFQSSSLAMSPASSTTSPQTSMNTLSSGPQPGMPFPWVGNASSSSSSSNPQVSQDQGYPPILNLGGINTPSGPGYPSGLNGMDSLTMPFDPSSEENDRHSSPAASSLSMASGSGSGSSRSRGASEEFGGGNHPQRRGGSSTTSGAKPTGSRRGSLEHVSFTLPVDGSTNNNNRGPMNPSNGPGPINPPNSNPSNRNLTSGEWEQLQRHQRQQLSEQRFKQQLQSSLLQQQLQQQQQERENQNQSPPYRFTNPLTGGDETPSNASSIPTSPFYSFSSLNDDGNGLNDLGINFNDLNNFGDDPGGINGMDLDLNLGLDGLLMNNNEMEDPSIPKFNGNGNGNDNANQRNQ